MLESWKSWKKVMLVKKVINQQQFENSNLIKENNKLIDQLDTIRFEHSYFINDFKIKLMNCTYKIDKLKI